jgi:hypothetical protein
MPAKPDSSRYVLRPPRFQRTWPQGSLFIVRSVPGVRTVPARGAMLVERVSTLGKSARLQRLVRIGRPGQA